MLFKADADLTCRTLHQQHGIAQLVGEYNPSKPDPSQAMIQVATRPWDSDNLEYGCKLLMRGVGLRTAAREVCFRIQAM